MSAIVFTLIAALAGWLTFALFLWLALLDVFTRWSAIYAVRRGVSSVQVSDFAARYEHWFPLGSLHAMISKQMRRYKRRGRAFLMLLWAEIIALGFITLLPGGVALAVGIETGDPANAITGFLIVMSYLGGIITVYRAARLITAG